MIDQPSTLHLVLIKLQSTSCTYFIKLFSSSHGKDDKSRAPQLHESALINKLTVKANVTIMHNRVSHNQTNLYMQCTFICFISVLLCWSCTQTTPERRESGNIWPIPWASLTLITFWGEFSIRQSMHCRKHNLWLQCRNPWLLQHDDTALFSMYMSYQFTTMHTVSKEFCNEAWGISQISQDPLGVWHKTTAMLVWAKDSSSNFFFAACLYKPLECKKELLTTHLTVSAEWVLCKCLLIQIDYLGQL